MKKHMFLGIAGIGLAGILSLSQKINEGSDVQHFPRLNEPVKTVTETVITSPHRSLANALLIRNTFTERSTIGKLYVNSIFVGYTLELPYQDNKPNISCIPPGEYEAVRRPANESAKFNYEHLRILEVPGRSDILIHAGNFPQDTQGCPLLGETKSTDSIGNSRVALAKLTNMLTGYDGARLKIVEQR